MRKSNDNGNYLYNCCKILLLQINKALKIIVTNIKEMERLHVGGG